MPKKYSSQHQSLTGFRHDRDRVQRRKRLLGILLGCTLLVLVFRTPVEGALATLMQFIARPFFVVANTTGEHLGGYAYLFRSKESLADENKRLKDALDLVAVEAASREMLRAENDYLKSVLGRHSDRSFLLARVLASPGSSPYDTLIIDAGADDAVIPGMSVYVDGDFIIGEVTRVFGGSAVVTLYSSSGNEFPVTIGTSSVPVTAFGVGGGNFRVVLPKGIEVFPGDIVEVPSFAPTYAGVVDAVKRPEGSSLQEIFFSWPGNMNALRYVYLDTKEGAALSNEAERP